MSLRGLPDIGDPFDVEAFLKAADLPDERNAFVLYRQAVAKLVPWSHGWVPDWRRANPDLRAWVVANRPALDLWLEGTRRPDAVAASPRETTTQTDMSVIAQLETLSIPVVLEASRRLDEGDVDGAWHYYLGAVRAGLHRLRFAGLMQRSAGGGMLSRATMGAQNWANDPRVGADRIRRAIADLGELRSLEMRVEDYLRMDYVVLRNTFRSRADVDQMLALAEGSIERVWLFQIPAGVMAFIKREPERSQRILQHAYTNWIREIQKPAAARALFDPRIIFMPPSPAALGVASNPAERELPPDRLGEWLDSSLIARVHMPPLASLVYAGWYDAKLIGDLRMSLANRLYRLENGRPPNRMRDLVGRYIDRLPDDYAKRDEMLDAKDAAMAKAIEELANESQ
jgi:hypothetical protein